jgi:peroxiredoxin
MRKVLSVLLLLTACGAVPAAALEIGQAAPDFVLNDVTGTEHSLSDYLKAGKTVVLEWFNPDCPFIKKHHQRFDTMVSLYASVKDKGVVWLAVNSGAPGKQGNGLERNVQAQKDYAIPYPVLLDESGKVGLAYGAKTTPHMFVIAPDGKLAYQGAIDDEPALDKLGKTNYVGLALADLAAGKPVATAQTQPYGCSVKYQQ